MILRHKDRELLRFEWVEPEGVRVVSVNERERRFLPLGMNGVATDEGLWKWLCRRTVPRNRHYVDAMLGHLGIRHGDTRAIIELCMGAASSGSAGGSPATSKSIEDDGSPSNSTTTINGQREAGEPPALRQGGGYASAVRIRNAQRTNDGEGAVATPTNAAPEVTTAPSLSSATDKTASTNNIHVVCDVRLGEANDNLVSRYGEKGSQRSYSILKEGNTETFTCLKCQASWRGTDRGIREVLFGIEFYMVPDVSITSHKAYAVKLERAAERL